MEWTAPTYAEIKMDAEIGSYQEERDEAPECPFVAETHDVAAAPAAP